MSSLYDYQGNKIVIAEDFEPQKDDIPIVSIDGVLPTSKSQGDYNVSIKYKSNTSEFLSYGTAKVQGDSSASYPKKNFTIKLFSDAGRTKKLKKLFS